MTTSAAPLTTSLDVALPTLEAFHLFAPELEFVPIDQLGDRRGPFVYTHVVDGGGVVYTGKNEAATRPGDRPRKYAFWVSHYLSKRGEGKDPMDDLRTGNLDLLSWSPIVRFASRHKPVVHVASVANTNESARVWEARLQALSGTLTANESLIGGSGWEANGWTNRGRGYAWVKKQILKLRAEGAL